MTGVGPGFVGCFEHFTSRTVERSNFCRLFRAFHVADSRESAILSAVPSISRRKQPRVRYFVGCFEHFSSQIAERSVFCRLFRTFLVADSREISLLSAVPSIPRRNQPRVRYSVGCSEHFTSQTAESPVFCRLFRAFHGANSREIRLLSAVLNVSSHKKPRVRYSVGCTTFMASSTADTQFYSRLLANQ